MKPSVIPLWVACSAFSTFMAYLIGYSHAMNRARTYMPKDIFQGGKGFYLNGPVLFALQLVALAAMGVLIFFLISWRSDKHSVLSSPHGRALFFIAPGVVVFLLFRWLSV